jgi:hypothetical protein
LADRVVNDRGREKRTPNKTVEASMAKKGNGHIVARIKQLRAEGFSKHDAGLMAYREAGHGKSKARGAGGNGIQGGRGIVYSTIAR